MSRAVIAGDAIGVNAQSASWMSPLVTLRLPSLRRESWYNVTNCDARDVHHKSPFLQYRQICVPIGKKAG